MLILRGITCLRSLENRLFPVLRLQSTPFSSTKVMAKPKGGEQEDLKPVKFTQSGAYRMNPEYATAIKPQGDKQPLYQSIMVPFSVIVFMIYFFILREENDMDDMILGTSLFDRVEGLEKTQIEVCIAHYEKNGLDTRDLKERLAELQAIEEAEDARIKAEEEAAEAAEAAKQAELAA
eukprot:TRINITY_DN40562_c0_g1_i1.p1 TRINITY_DN40562_c0_g1~~TRINITY_DN40562_c0_g1_i1.p1  ORF type:complete len:188 (-),score=30.04 TRINITY_DN40562_c0_g1_i1:190-723(-)